MPSNGAGVASDQVADFDVAASDSCQLFHHRWIDLFRGRAMIKRSFVSPTVLNVVLTVAPGSEFG